MAKPGTITLPEDRFVELLVNAGRSLKAGGFKTILFVGESGGNRTGMRTAAEKLNELWKGDGAHAFWIDDYYTKAHADQNKCVTENVGIPADQIGNHANILDTSELLFVNAEAHSQDDGCPGNDYENNGVSGEQPVEVDAGNRQGAPPDQDRQRVAQIKGSWRERSSAPAAATPGDAGGGGRGGRGGAAVRRPAPTARRDGPADDDHRAGRRRRRPQAPDTVFIDELTWEETRDALKAGKTTVDHSRPAAPRRTATTWCSASTTTSSRTPPT